MGLLTRLLSKIRQEDLPVQDLDARITDARVLDFFDGRELEMEAFGFEPPAFYTPMPWDPQHPAQGIDVPLTLAGKTALMLYFHDVPFGVHYRTTSDTVLFPTSVPLQGSETPAPSAALVEFKDSKHKADLGSRILAPYALLPSFGAQFEYCRFLVSGLAPQEDMPLLKIVGMADDAFARLKDIEIRDEASAERELGIVWAAHVDRENDTYTYVPLS